jgi:hypothetical protein
VFPPAFSGSPQSWLADRVAYLSMLNREAAAAADDDDDDDDDE